MSGAMSPALAQAASAIALQAEAAAAGLSVGRLIQRQVQQKFAKRESAEGMPGRTWRGMSHRTRQVLVMLGTDEDGDPAELARRPWGAFTDRDQLRMGAVARELSRDLAGAWTLF